MRSMRSERFWNDEKQDEELVVKQDEKQDEEYDEKARVQEWVLVLELERFGFLFDALLLLHILYGCAVSGSKTSIIYTTHTVK